MQLVDRLRSHVRHLAGEIGERNIWHPDALTAAADYIRDQWRTLGYRVDEQNYELSGIRCANLEVRGGDSHDKPIIVIGAHYDTVMGSPGANDNASGVAALLELPHLLEDSPETHRLRFVAFVNEEAPFFATDCQGSERYAGRARENDMQIELMISLETIGYYSDTPGSQAYPPFLRWLYPDRANFVALISNLRYRRQLRRVHDAFRKSSDFPVQRLSGPATIPGLSWSDHHAFWHYGYPAIMMTDTAFYRYPYYHTPLDTPDRVDYARLAHVTRGLSETLRRLVSSQAIR